MQADQTCSKTPVQAASSTGASTVKADFCNSVAIKKSDTHSPRLDIRKGSVDIPILDIADPVVS